MDGQMRFIWHVNCLFYNPINCPDVINNYYCCEGGDRGGKIAAKILHRINKISMP